MMKKTILKILSISFALFLLAVITACNKGGSNDDEVNNKEVLHIAAFVYRFDDPFIGSIMDEIQYEAENLANVSGKDIQVEFIDGNNQKDIQYNQILEYIELDYDALMVNLVDRSDARRVIDLAKAADIPLVFFNREPVQVDMARWNQIYYVGTIGIQSGVLQGEIIADYWKAHPEADKNGDGILQYVLLKGQEGHQDAILRTEYSIRTIEEKGISVEELASDVANWQRDQAKDQMFNYLDLFPNSIEFIISNNDMMALGAIDALEERGFVIQGNYPIVGVDAVDEAQEALESDKLVGTVRNDNVEQGRMTMMIAYYLAVNDNPNKYIDAIEEGKYYWVPYEKVVE